jgi:hypothetical protein
MFAHHGQLARALLGAVFVAGGLAGGCVSEEMGRTPADELTYTAVRTEDRVQLSWDSKPGEKYTVLYSETRRPDHPWQPLPDAMNLVGTGRTITVEDRVPEGQSRYYRLLRGSFPPTRSR